MYYITCNVLCNLYVRYANFAWYLPFVLRKTHVARKVILWHKAWLEFSPFTLHTVYPICCFLLSFQQVMAFPAHSSVYSLFQSWLSSSRLSGIVLLRLLPVLLPRLHVTLCKHTQSLLWSFLLLISLWSCVFMYIHGALSILEFFRLILFFNSHK
jgi:hypothetical protein